MHNVCVCAWGVRAIVQLLDAQLENNTGRRTARLAAPLALTPVRYEAVLHNCVEEGTDS